MIKPRIALLYCYFGSFPSYFGLWLKSAANNPSVDFLFFTDQIATTDLPKNVHFIEKSLTELENEFSSLLGFPARIGTPKKLCDYKPLFFYAFRDYCSAYEYWGFGDIDTILGNFDLLFHVMRGGYDCFFSRGHLQIFRNTSSINRLPLVVNDPKYLHLVFNELPFQTVGFDEFSHSRAFYLQKESVFLGEDLVADIQVSWPELTLVGEHKKKYLFVHFDNKLVGIFREEGRLCEREYLYIHLQKRRMDVRIENAHTNRYIITPKGFVDYKPITPSNYKILCRPSVYNRFRFFQVRIRWLKYYLPRKVLNCERQSFEEYLWHRGKRK